MSTTNMEKNWIFRPPPFDILYDDLKLCSVNKQHGLCKKGDKCDSAHSDLELCEWRERYKFKESKLSLSKKNPSVHETYTEILFHKLSVQGAAVVFTYSVDGIMLTCDQDLNILSNKQSHQWVFSLVSNKKMVCTALLNDIGRMNFKIDEVKMNSCADIITLNPENDQEFYIGFQNSVGTYVYEIKIVFKTDIFGQFSQTIVFDFGHLPVLTRNLELKILPFSDLSSQGSEDGPSVSKSLRDRTNVHHHNAGVVGSKQFDVVELSLAALNCKFSVEDYWKFFSSLLYLEEQAQINIINLHSGQYYLILCNSYESCTGSVTSTNYCCGNELFAQCTMKSSLGFDSPCGRLILLSCNSALVRFGQNSDWYRLMLIDKRQHTLIFKIPQNIVEYLGLRVGVSCECFLNFELNSEPFKDRHAALENIKDYSILFPNNEEFDLSMEFHKPISPMPPVLNKEQAYVVNLITSPLEILIPPILLCGPFGTGKTHTLSQSIKILLTRSDSKVLICTLSNSAADLYILKYFHPQIEKDPLCMTLLRLYYYERWMSTVNPVIQNYCLTSNSGAGVTFRNPTVEEVLNHNVVVVTLGSCKILANIGLPKGTFTHIFIDEAAQAMECDAIIPLQFASHYTRIILAGDPMQMNPEVYSPIASQMNLKRSLLERLYESYPSQHPCKVDLVVNYRSHPDIINFTSKVFYNQTISAAQNYTEHPIFKAITLFHIDGEEGLSTSNPSYFNLTEANEICKVVHDIIISWPESWGSCDLQSIGVISPYTEQVNRIRDKLREEKLGSVCVETIRNVQGKEFDVILLSTVRTRKSCPLGSNQYCKFSSLIDYGFMTSPKLLNTAITRAKHLVLVFGHLPSMFTIGRCSSIWAEFLMKHPDTLSIHNMEWVQLLKTIVLENCTQARALDPDAKEYRPQH